MILSDKTLKKLIKTGELVIDPITDESIQPASIDCRLGNHFLVMDDLGMEVVTLNDEIKYREVEKDEIIIPPRSFLLGTTMEYLKLPADLSVFIEGRSSVGRMGLFIENAGWIDPGFKGNLTLELYNASSIPIKLEAGRRICQFVFCKMDYPADEPYGSQKHGGKYQGQKKTVGSRIFKDVENKK